MVLSLCSRNFNLFE